MSSTSSLLVNILNRLSAAIFGSQTRPPPNGTFVQRPLAVPHRTIGGKELARFDEVVIIGDLHGCFDEWRSLLEQIHSGIEPKKILKICTGDLINKGPKNLQVIDYFMNNSDHCISVRGNHDQVIIDQYVQFMETGQLKEKNEWMRTMTERHYRFLEQLPYTIAIPERETIIVHAGLVPGVPLTEQKPHNMMEMRNLLIDPDTGAMVATKKDTVDDASGRVAWAWASLWPGPMHVYFGHDAKRGLQECRFATGLDTGLVYGKHLTGRFILGPRQEQYITVKALQMWKNPEAK